MRFYVIISSFLILIFTVGSIVAVLTRRGTGRIPVVFSLFATSVLLWIVPYLYWQLSTTPADALKWCRWLVAGSILIPLTYIHFVVTLTENRAAFLLRICGVISVVLLCISPTSMIVANVEPRGGFAYWPVPGVLFAVYLLYFIAVTGFAFRFLLRRYLESSMQGRNQLKYLIWGTAVGFIGGSSNFLLWLKIPVPPIGQGLGVFYVLGIGYSIIKFRLMEFNFMVVRIIGYLSALTAIAFLGAVSTQWLWRIISPQAVDPSVYSWWVMLMLAVMIVSPVLLFMVNRFDGFIERHLVVRAYDYRAQLREVATDIFNLDDETEIFRKTVSSLQSILRLRRVALFCRNELEARFILREQVGLNLKETGNLKSMESVVDLLRLHFERKTGASSIEELIVRNADGNVHVTTIFERDDLAVPIRAGGALLGFIVIGLRNNRDIYSAVDVAVIEGVAFQLGLAIRARQLERQANQTEKLIALGTLAAGLAHEIRNPLVSIRTFSELIGEQGADPEFRREFKSVVGRDVSRIATIVENISAFADNAQVKASSVDIHEVINGVYDIARPEFVQAGVGFEAPATAIHLVSGNYSQLLQVFLNLFQNAIHALEGRPDPKVTVGYRLVNDDEGGRTLIVSVSDNGAGIDDVVRARIFDPFITTKATGDGQKRGMGLGLAIVKRIVEGHRGAITVTSEAGRGATFFVHLPCLS